MKLRYYSLVVSIMIGSWLSPFDNEWFRFIWGTSWSAFGWTFFAFDTFHLWEKYNERLHL